MGNSKLGILTDQNDSTFELRNKLWHIAQCRTMKEYVTCLSTQNSNRKIDVASTHDVRF